MNKHPSLKHISSIYNVLPRRVQQAFSRTYVIGGAHYETDESVQARQEDQASPNVDICVQTEEVEADPGLGSVYFHLFFVVFAAIFLPIPNLLCGFLLGSACVTLVGLLVLSFAGQVVVDNIEEAFFREKMEKGKPSPRRPASASTPPLQEWLKLQTSENKNRVVVFSEFCDDLMVISYPKLNIDPHNVKTDIRTAEFIQRRKVNVGTARVFLLPPDLTPRKFWSKKHPLCVDTPSGPTFYLFFTSQRSKEVWYRRLRSATGAPVFPPAALMHSHLSGRTQGIPFYETDQVDTQEEAAKRLAHFYNYMSENIPEHFRRDVSTDWLNVLLRRLSYHVCTSCHWRERLCQKVEHKFGTMDLPSVIDHISVKSIEIGPNFPEILRLDRPKLDSMGLWLDFSLTYGGGFRIQLQTKIDLLRLLQENTEEASDSEYARDSKVQAILKRVTSSSYFKRAMELRFLKSSMENIANTPLLLDVEVTGLEGTMTLNMPNPPTDRIWFGFRGTPSLHLVVKPKVGDRNINDLLCKLVKRILVNEFEREAVFPNMVDLVVPFFVDPHVVVGNAA